MSQPPDTALQIAFTSQGLRRAGLAGRGDRRSSPTNSAPAWRLSPTVHAAWATSARTLPRRWQWGGSEAPCTAPPGDAVRASRAGSRPGRARSPAGKWAPGLRSQIARLRHSRHRRDRAVRLRRRHQPARDRLELRAGPRRPRAARLRQRPGAWARYCSATPTSTALHRPPAARPGLRRRGRGSCRRPG